MGRFQILCVTMNQKDFSKIKEMNIHSDVVFANQSGRTAFEQIEFEGHTAKMITTNTRGVGINRNLGLMYADAEICLFADDDVTYVDDMEERVLREFDAHPEADVMIFNLDITDGERKQIHYPKTRRCRAFDKMGWGGCRIAFRLNAMRKANIWFTTLFGGGCLFCSGEDSMWLQDAKRKGLTFFVSRETIGTVSFAVSTWYTGKNRAFFYSKGAYCKAVHPYTFSAWMLYYALRYGNDCEISFKEKVKQMRAGAMGYLNLISFGEAEKHY